ncbi:hemerythrin domain-containing protein [Roseovarius sp. S4756]|uniref:hemerythrin domain-containing protein n=1 Tax=Roseovarius maritimus TaxID=3342637 RepID=UPI00372CB364
MKQSEPTPREGGLPPSDHALLLSPLDFISEDHLRERQICAVIDGLAGGARIERQAALTVLRFVNEELNMHMRDEAEDLFPILSRRCKAEDEIEKTISRIRHDLDAASRLLPKVRAILCRCLDTGSDLAPEERETLSQFAGHVREHLVAENAILLPIARARLTPADLRKLSQHMRRRRGLPVSVEDKHAE